MTTPITDIPPGFLAAILERPHNDTPRLVLADWLDEHAGTVLCGDCRWEWRRCRRCGAVYQYAGKYSDCESPGCEYEPSDPAPCRTCDGKGEVPDGRAARAEFIRVQCELARHPAARLNPDATYGEYPDLRRRERALWEMKAGDRWAIDYPDVGAVTGTDVHACLPTDGIATAERTHYPVLVVRRGFVDEIRCPLEVWVGEVCGRCGGDGRAHGSDRPFEWSPSNPYPGRCPAGCYEGRVGGIGPAVVRSQPVTRVEATDREPEPWDWPGPNGRDYSWAWVGSGPSVLPRDVYDLLPGTETFVGDLPLKLYPTPAAARDALSAALLTFARRNP